MQGKVPVARVMLEREHIETSHFFRSQSRYRSSQPSEGRRYVGPRTVLFYKRLGLGSGFPVRRHPTNGRFYCFKTSQGRIIIGSVRVRVKFPGKEVPHK